MEENKEIILSLDVSTTCIGICLLLNDGSDYGKIIELTHINPKSSKKKANGIEEIFLKKRCFEEYIQKFKNFNITKAVIEEPLLSSNNQNTVSTGIFCILRITICVISNIRILLTSHRNNNRPVVH